MTPTSMAHLGATTAARTRVKMFRQHGRAILFFMAPKTAAIANVEHGTLTAM